MHRFTISLSLALVVLLGVVAVGASPSVRAQDATPAAETALPPVLQQWIAAAAAGDGEALAALYAPDGIYEDVPSQTIAQGRDELAAFFNGIVGQQQDSETQIRAVHLTDDGAVLEYTLSGTDSESGMAFTFAGAIIFELEGDAIRRSANYYDVATILAQLGVLDNGQHMGEATPAP